MRKLRVFRGTPLKTEKVEARHLPKSVIRKGGFPAFRVFRIKNGPRSAMQSEESVIFCYFSHQIVACFIVNHDTGARLFLIDGLCIGNFNRNYLPSYCIAR